MNEFDRFVRHQIKPYAYLRYGDDFIVFVSSKDVARRVQTIASDWLLDNLRLKLHPKNNAIVSAKHGLKFLGHQIYPQAGISIDSAMDIKVKTSINRQNAASYKSMYLTKQLRDQFAWLILPKIEDGNQIS
jgi:hypothetical protein